jgi:hypothetical protein
MLLRQHPKAAGLTLRCYFARAVSKGDRQLGDDIPCERGFADHASASATLPALRPTRTKMARSERIPVSPDVAAATVNPHRLAAFAWTVIGHAGSAPWRSCDLAALDHD